MNGSIYNYYNYYYYCNYYNYYNYYYYYIFVFDRIIYKLIVIEIQSSYLVREFENFCLQTSTLNRTKVMKIFRFQN